MAHNNQREQLAAQQHEIWSAWVKHMFEVSTNNPDGTVTIPTKYVEQWQREINTAYSDLTEDEKDGDREQADKIIRLLDKSQDNKPDGKKKPK